MRTAVTLLVIISVSCGLSACNIRDINQMPEQTGKSSYVPKKDKKPPTLYSNREIWQKIVEKPDSVALAVEINDSTNALLTISGKRDSSYYKPYSIKITFSDGTNQNIQVKTRKIFWVDGEPHPFVRFDDVNFDGNRDLQLFDNAGVVNYWYNVWLYRTKNSFSFSEDFTNTPSPKIDASQKQIMSYYRFGGCEENVGYYIVRDDSLQPVRYIYSKPEGCITYKKELMKGEWVIINLGEWDISLYDSLYRE